MNGLIGQRRMARHRQLRQKATGGGAGAARAGKRIGRLAARAQQQAGRRSRMMEQGRGKVVEKAGGSRFKRTPTAAPAPKAAAPQAPKAAPVRAAGFVPGRQREARAAHLVQRAEKRRAAGKGTKGIARQQARLEKRSARQTQRRARRAMGGGRGGRR
jgi:hypothetical protein